MSDAQDVFVRDTRRWLERAVIGLNLCPFAKAVHAKGQVHYAVSAAKDPSAVLDDVRVELDELVARSAADRETTLLIVPRCLDDFLQFNDLVAQAERLVRRRGLEGVIQLASFHPRFQFQGTEPDDITNCTNRSPYPTVHLLREESIDRAVQAFPDAEAIYETNMETMRQLGAQGWDALQVGPSR
jgi:uncharacterized protein